jgi:hypothetical protein
MVMSRRFPEREHETAEPRDLFLPSFNFLDGRYQVIAQLAFLRHANIVSGLLRDELCVFCGCPRP